jgi:hypothetical protein
MKALIHKIVHKILNKFFVSRKFRYVSYSQTAEDLLLDVLLQNEKKNKRILY